MAAFSQLVIYYFSGTGNSANVARWLAKCAEERGIPARTVNIVQCTEADLAVQPETTLIAFCSPVHGFNYPPVMQAFIRRFPKGKNPVLLLNTRAGMLIGKWITPGLSGITFYLSALILSLKGYRIKAMFPVDLPSNWISVHPGLNDRTVRYLHERNKERVRKFAHRTLGGRTDFRSLRELVQDVLISPVSIGYYFAGRYFIAKTYYANMACNGCNLCVLQCPVQAIKMVDNRPFWRLKCESCMHCMSYCPQKAIETAHGSAAAFAVLFSVIVWHAIEVNFGASQLFVNDYSNFAIKWGSALALFVAWYRMLHYVLRYQWFNKALTYTSLTFYRFWGRRYKALKKNV